MDSLEKSNKNVHFLQKLYAEFQAKNSKTAYGVNIRLAKKVVIKCVLINILPKCKMQYVDNILNISLSSCSSQ